MARTPSIAKSPMAGRGRQDRWFVYVLRCGDGSFYTGIAKDVRERLAAHAGGKGARYTKGRGPLSVVAMHRCHSKGRALRLEHAFKQLSKSEKAALLQAPDSAGLRAFARRWRSPKCARA